MTTKEYIICAAIWYKEQPTAKILPKNISKGVVVGGMRHGHCIHTFVALTGKRSVTPECGENIQGFLTSKNNFVDRIQGAAIAFRAKQTKELLPYLYSEDLY